jgi:hypothetical protein
MSLARRTPGRCCLQDGGDKDQGVFRVPLSLANTLKFVCEDGEEASSHLPLWDLIAGRG